MLCANCRKLIVLPLPGSPPDPSARKGDLCDACEEIERAGAEVEADLCEEERLNGLLRRRPR